MSTMHSATPISAFQLSASRPSYAGNVAAAAQALFLALFSFKAAAAAPAPSARQRMRAIGQLSSMARQCDAMAPSLASELRYFAGKL
ncbi:MAG: hypothetical protein ACRYGK_00055 [Janthinobacterium lividum]